MKHPKPAFQLPDLCNVQRLLMLILLAELLVLANQLFMSGIRQFDWSRFGITSVYVLWVVILSASALCQCRRWIGRLSLAQGVSTSLVLILLVVSLCNLAAQALYIRMGEGFDWSFLARDLLVALLMGGIALRYFYLSQLLQAQREAELRARIDALQARIRPHFLFNSMNIIASLIAVDPDKAEQVVIDLSELFRASLNHEEQLVSLSDELQLCRRYVAIEQLRLGSRLQMDWQLPEPLPDIQIPALCLQPLLENAIYHGIQALPAGGTVSLQVELKQDSLLITLTNPTAESPGRSLQSSHQGNQMAVENIRHRLHAHYGQRAGLELMPQAGEFVARLQLPVSVAGTEVQQ